MELHENSRLPKWYFSEMKGPTDDDCNEADQISAMSFDNNGQFLATGDRGGRVVIFKSNYDASTDNIKYEVYGTFTSHEAGFDYLKSVEIEEKINKIEWLPQINDSRSLLTTNDKVIKLWRVKERSNRPLTDFSNRSIRQSNNSCMYSKRVESNCRKTYANAHAFNINSLSVNSDQETFLSCDELRINIWHLQHTDQSFNIVDLKPPNMENLTEVITCAKFHPSNCSSFVYSSSKGLVRLCDMRVKALCDEASLQFIDDSDTDGGSAGKSFFSDIISSISDIQVSHSGNMLMARDYLNIKIWDMRSTHRPVKILPVHEHFRAKLCGLYENDCIFDKFECSWSPDDKFVITGSYNNFLRQFNVESGTSETLQIHKSTAQNPFINLPSKQVCARSPTASSGMRNTGSGIINDNEIPLDSIDLSKKLLHLQWHPKHSLLSLATTHNLYFLQNHSVVSSMIDVYDLNEHSTQYFRDNSSGNPLDLELNHNGFVDGTTSSINISTTNNVSLNNNDIQLCSSLPQQMEVDEV